MAMLNFLQFDHIYIQILIIFITFINHISRISNCWLHLLADQLIWHSNFWPPDMDPLFGDAAVNGLSNSHRLHEGGAIQCHSSAMSAECANPIETELDTLSGQSSKLTSQQMQCVAQLKQWVEDEADFYGNTDEDFLLIFVCGCKFNVAKAKKNMAKYYEGRKKVPQWWANRDIMEERLWPLFQAKMTTALKENDASKPTIAITQTCRLPQRNCNVDDDLRFHTIVLESVLRRRNSIVNGVIWIMDIKHYPQWLLPQLISPIVLKNAIRTFMSISLRVKGVYLLNCPSVSLGIWPLVKPFAGRHVKDRVFFYGSNWDELFDHIPIEDLPEEYGGRGGPMGPQEDAFMEELIAFNEQILKDNKYGYVDVY